MILYDLVGALLEEKGPVPNHIAANERLKDINGLYRVRVWAWREVANSDEGETRESFGLVVGKTGDNTRAPRCELAGLIRARNAKAHQSWPIATAFSMPSASRMSITS